MIGTYHHILVYARRHGSHAFLQHIHDTNHNTSDVHEFERHNYLFTLPSEWYGNPFLFAAEVSHIRQALYFLESIPEDERPDDFAEIRGMGVRLLQHAVDGPDHSTIVQQRLLGMYRLIGQPPVV